MLLWTMILLPTAIVLFSDVDKSVSGSDWTTSRPDDSATIGSQSQPLQTLYIGSFYPITGSLSSFGGGLIPAAQLAVEHINVRLDVLPGYKLELINVDTQNEASVVVHELFKMIVQSPIKIMLLGGFGTVETDTLAGTSRWWNLISVSPSAFGPELSDRNTYPLFFRTRASLTSFDPARIALLEAFDWQRVGIISAQADAAILAVNVLTTDLNAANISVVSFEAYPLEGMPVGQLARMKARNVRIIIVIAFDEYVRRIFCQARRTGMTTDQYVWIMHAGNNPYWMNLPTSDGTCSAAEIHDAAQNHFVTSDFVSRTDDVIPISGLTNSGFLDAYHAVVSRMNAFNADFYAGLTYDAVWAMALALNGSIPVLAAANKTLSDFSYEDANSTAVFLDQMYRVKFYGQSGDIQFTDTGDLVSVLTNIQRFQNDTYVNIATHRLISGTTGQLVWVNPVSWPGGAPPADHRVTINIPVYTNRKVFVVITSFSVAGMCLSLAAVVFNITKRKTKLIRMSSPNLNNMVVAGCVICYLAAILFGIDGVYQNPSGFVAICHSKIVLLSCGFSLGFGSLFAKTWRVFKIFSNKTAVHTVILDRHLFAIVGAIISIDFVFFLIWFTADPLEVVGITQLYDDVGLLDDDFLYEQTQWHCTSPHIAIWQSVLFIIKAILLLFGAFLAWQTRAVSIPALNDSKYIGFALYNVLILSLLGVPVPLILDASYVDVIYGYTGTCILLAVTITLGILFVPKVLAMRTGTVADALSTETEFKRNMKTSRNDASTSQRDGSAKTAITKKDMTANRGDERSNGTELNVPGRGDGLLKPSAEVDSMTSLQPSDFSLLAAVSTVERPLKTVLTVVQPACKADFYATSSTFNSVVGMEFAEQYM